nr:unnamed protein product [Salmo salar]|eukprot:XP_014041602.1 PREDICTED: vacuolar protein sorting-associated protein 13B-like [Salmo salar]
MPGTLVVCLPQITVLSAGHKYMEPLQDLPFMVSRTVLEEGDAFPWTLTLSQFSVYTLLGQQRSLSLLQPMGCTSTLAVTSHKLQAAGPDGRHAFIVCLHVDLEPLSIKISNPQVIIHTHSNPQVIIHTHSNPQVIIHTHSNPQVIIHTHSNPQVIIHTHSNPQVIIHTHTL